MLFDDMGSEDDTHESLLNAIVDESGTRMTIHLCVCGFITEAIGGSEFDSRHLSQAIKYIIYI